MPQGQACLHGARSQPQAGPHAVQPPQWHGLPAVMGERKVRARHAHAQGLTHVGKACIGSNKRESPHFMSCSGALKNMLQRMLPVHCTRWHKAGSRPQWAGHVEGSQEAVTHFKRCCIRMWSSASIQANGRAVLPVLQREASFDDLLAPGHLSRRACKVPV